MVTREGITGYFFALLRRASQQGRITKQRADELELMVDEFFATHWRDDDSPQAERTFGVRKT